MKLTLTHRNEAPSKSVLDMIEAQLETLESSLQIDEATVHLERSLTKSPPYDVTFHLVTPGPDIMADANDHTMRAAVLKAFKQIGSKIEHRHSKRSSRREVAPAIELTRRRPAGGKRI
jgi:ribosome-associated translation inhibitor RaiA